MVPGNSDVIDGDLATVFVAIINDLVINIKGWCAGDIKTFADAHIEFNFLGDISRGEVADELLKIAIAVGDGFEIFAKECSAFGSGGVGPLVLLGEEFVHIFFPVTLQTGGFGGGGSGGAVLVVRK